MAATNLVPVDDPATFGFPAGLPIEIALGQHKPKAILAAYGMGKSDWDRLIIDPSFLKALEDAVEMLQKEGASFRMKARVQSEALLGTSWALIHDTTEEVPATVKADLIKWTMRVAGLDASQDQKAATAASNQNNFQININLGD